MNPSWSDESPRSFEHASFHDRIGRAVEALPPPAASGIGAVLEQERDLLSATDSFLRGHNGQLSPALHATLREQHANLEEKIGRLTQYYRMPSSAIAADSALGPSESIRSEIAPENMGPLTVLIAQHRTLIGAIASLTTQHFDGQRGNLILTGAARSHEQMAENLTQLLAENPALADPASSIVLPTPSEARWENEGGATPTE
jgi:hypothetical protein